MKKFWLVSLFLISISGLVSAQKHVCGMTREDLNKVTERLLYNRENLANEAQDRTVKYVPVRFIIVGNDDGTGFVKELKILDLLCSLNERFAPLEIQFYLLDNAFKYLKSTEVNLHQSTNLQLAKMNAVKSSKAINYFITDACDFGNNPGGNLIVLGYYTPDKDWLVIKESEITGLSSTVAHETGHFFSLLHPFNGWDHDPWEAGSTACAPAIAPDGVTKTEKVDGSNALIAGDFLAETKASYNFVYDDAGCSGGYTGGAKDPMCVPLAGVTMADNYMDYFENCQTYSFTADQGTAMKADLNSSARNFLDNTYAPPATDFAQQSNLVEPADGATTPYQNLFTFKWNAVPGATHYLLEITLGGGASSPVLYSVWTQALEHTTTGFNVTNGQSRYWRVSPMNNYFTCKSGMTTSRKFTAGLTIGTANIDGLNAWAITPNPANLDSDLTIQTMADASFEATIELNSVSGQLVFSEKNHAFAAGESAYILPTGNSIAPGAYFVTLINGTNRLTKKLIITN